jgi:hypothetical protein
MSAPTLRISASAEARDANYQLLRSQGYHPGRAWKIAYAVQRECRLRELRRRVAGGGLAKTGARRRERAA